MLVHTPLADIRPHPVVGVLALERIRYADIARRLGYSQVHIMNVVNGRSRPSPELARKIADLAGVPVEAAFRPEVFS
jgi:transcriptional regulator with XRE-family HTH domain